MDENLFLNWKLKARNLLVLACGEKSEHYRTFVENEKGSGYSTNHAVMLKLKSLFEAAREDFEGGYCRTAREIVSADIFSSELDQATNLLRTGYKAPAAVIVGVVLETALREVCASSGVPAGKLDKMNADLAKRGTYSLLVQKRITALADIRNNAAHGYPDRFSPNDVEDMISYVSRFLSDAH